ncbi:hypothetical protein [Arthrobacter tecti]
MHQEQLREREAMEEEAKSKGVAPHVLYPEHFTNPARLRVAQWLGKDDAKAIAAVLSEMRSASKADPAAVPQLVDQLAEMLAIPTSKTKRSSRRTNRESK